MLAKLVPVFAVVSAVCMPQVFADVTDFNVAKIQFFEQDSADAPTTAVIVGFNAFLDAAEGDIGSVTVGGADALLEINPGEWCFEAPFASLALLDAAYPGAQTYELAIAGGAVGTRSEAMVLVDPQVFPAPPALLPSSFANIQSTDAGSDLLIEWIAPDAATDLIILDIYDAADDTGVVDLVLPATDSSFLLPAENMSPGRTYVIELIFAHGSVLSGTADTGFGETALGLAAYASVTSLEFTTAGCDADLNGDGFVDFFDVQAFLNFYASGDLRADFTPDGVLDFFDVQAFLNAYAAGCS